MVGFTIHFFTSWKIFLGSFQLGAMGNHVILLRTMYTYNYKPSNPPNQFPRYLRSRCTNALARPGEPPRKQRSLGSVPGMTTSAIASGGFFGCLENIHILGFAMETHGFWRPKSWVCRVGYRINTQTLETCG